ncbi:MAG: cysteine desulfurase [Deltaproteobacteria bacterium]|nr:cysteine desulfurase [Deltaproteobacteria bacterium]MDG1861536.1 cysteine desulfurase family protein [SAR324 cluster bacterium]MBT4184413.1 cysteine desulfurase [Deltaproteobacteria bacterium]MBT5086484.1 cysteine desulfurase [Deltaproteobacteria bacterium]MBT5486110.1 cysteine desulfurase [Deltaproteobacteria bacterium]
MSDSKIYLDHNATSPLLPEVENVMSEVAQQTFANPSSPHWAGRNARFLLEEARDNLANSLGVKSQEILFTSGGTESNNTVLRQLLMNSAEQHLIVSAVEHPSVLETCRILGGQPNIQFTELAVDSSGIVEPGKLREALRPETSLISVMTANNETGNLQPVEELSKIAQENKIPFHTDLVQAYGKMQLDLSSSGVNFASATAHKLGGPCGIGLLYVKQGTAFESLISGGKQERVRRAGTENVVLAVGFAKAVGWYLGNQLSLRDRFSKFRDLILNEINKIKGIFLNTDLGNSMPHTLNFGCKKVSAESLLISLDLDGVAVSTGSACSSGAMEASPVLLAMGLSRAEAKSSLRVSWGWSTTEADIDFFCQRLTFHILRLQEKQITENL